uniref:HEAT repeat domain-containing protein n=1 Tax=Eiseniibacteriota bacterium TaxID=2212470 RepID=A0A832MK44_UNCEI
MRTSLLVWALAGAVVAAAVAAPLYLAAAIRRRARREARARAHDLAYVIGAFLRREAPRAVLRRAVAGVDADTVWRTLDAIAPRARGRRALGAALDRWPGLSEERHALRGDDTPRRAVAAHRLGLLASRRARKALRRALKHAPEPVAAAAALALARAGDAWALRQVLDRPQRLAHRSPRARFALLRAFGPRALPAIHDALERDAVDPQLARAALETLGAAGYTPATASIERRLHDPEPELRVAAARALGRLGAGAHVISLRRALQDPHWPVRAQAARALGRLRAAHCEDALADCLSDPAWWVRRHAAYALAELGEPGWRALQEIARVSPDPYARDMAAEVIEGGWRRDSA